MKFCSRKCFKLATIECCSLRIAEKENELKIETMVIKFNDTVSEIVCSAENAEDLQQLKAL